MRKLLIYLLFTGNIAFAQQQSVATLLGNLHNQPDTGKISTYIAVSKLYETDQPDSAVDYANQGMRLAKKMGNRHYEAVLLLQLGKINTLHHHTDLGRRFYNEALSIFRNLHETDGIAHAYDELGLLDGGLLNINSATHDLYQAMRFYKNMHDSSGILETYYGLGTVFEQKGETEKALTYYLRALVQYEHQVQKPGAYFDLLDKIGHIYIKKGDIHSALHYLQEGVQNSVAASDRDTEITMLDEEGKAYQHAGEKEQALFAYKQALTVAKEFNKPEQEAKALIDIAGLLKKENVTQSLRNLKQALHIADSLRHPKLQANIYAALSAVYEQQKNYKEAMIALEEQHRLLDSLLNTDTTKDIAELDSSYKLESSREQIESLKLINKKEKAELNLGSVAIAAVLIGLIIIWIYVRKVRKLNTELKASNQLKDMLFSVIGHDLKGPAGNAAQLFSLMETEDFTEAELKVMISELRQQTTASFELLNSLFEWGRAQLQGVSVSQVALLTKPLITHNITLLNPQANKKNIVINDYTQADLKIFVDRNHFDFVIRNLLSNAIKFTFNNGRIDINAEQSKKEVIFSVSDSGKGISPEQQQAFFKSNITISFGTGGEKGSGLGLLLIKQFLQVNKGKIWLTSTEGNGTTFYFALPLAH